MHTAVLFFLFGAFVNIFTKALSLTCPYYIYIVLPGIQKEKTRNSLSCTYIQDFLMWGFQCYRYRTQLFYAIIHTTHPETLLNLGQLIQHASDTQSWALNGSRYMRNK